MFLTTTSDIVRLVTAQAVSTIGVQASWIDYNGSSYTPGRTNTAITGATTTTIVGSPGSSTYRRVRKIEITNNHASSSCVVTLQHFDNTTSIDIEKITLLATERLVWDENGAWKHLTSWGAEYDYAGRQLRRGKFGITGAIAETVPRNICTAINTNAITSGTMNVFPILLRAGDIVTNISFFSGSQAAVTPTAWWFALYDGDSKALLARSADQTSTAWAATTIKTLAMQTPYTIPHTGRYYVTMMMAAATPVNLLSGPSHSPQTLLGSLTFPPFLLGTADASLTTTPPPTMGAVTVTATGNAWACIT